MMAVNGREILKILRIIYRSVLISWCHVAMIAGWIVFNEDTFKIIWRMIAPNDSLSVNIVMKMYLMISLKDHLEICVDYPTTCTNEECGKKVPCHQMPSHKASCPKEMISCGYRSVGCEEKMKREEQEEHNEQWRERHLQLASGEVNKLHSTITDLHQKTICVFIKTIQLRN